MSEKDVGAELAALRAEVADLKARVEAQAKPQVSIKELVDAAAGEARPTIAQLAMDRLSMPVSAIADLVRAVPDAEVRGVVNDVRATAVLAPLASPTGTPVSAQNTSGWRTANAPKT